MGRKRALILFGVAQSITVGGYGLVAAGYGNLPFLYVICGAEHFAGGMATAALFTCMMDWCRKGRHATDYTIQASTVVVATGVASTLSGFSASAWGYTNHFTIATLLSLFGVVAAARLFPRERVVVAQPARIRAKQEVESWAH